MTSDDFDELARTWGSTLRDEGKPANTIRAYLSSVRCLTAWQREHGKSGLTPDGVRGFAASILDRGGARNTARLRMKALLQFSKWLAAEGIIGHDELAGLQPPAPGDVLVPRLSDEQVGALIAACAADRTIYGCRDEAFIRLAADVPVRIEELLCMDLPGHLDIPALRASLVNTKGRKERRVPFSVVTARTLCRYLGMRNDSGMPADGPLWLSQRRGRLSYSALRKSLDRRAGQAGIPDFFPYRLRHTAAIRWLLDGGSEGSLMKIGGWARRDMVDHYVREARAEIALMEGDQILRRRAAC